MNDISEEMKQAGFTYREPTEEEIKKRFIDMMSEEMKGYELVYKPPTEQKKVWILVIDSSTMREILGVYSCQKKAYEKYQKFLEHFSGSSNYSGVVIIERELE